MTAAYWRNSVLYPATAATTAATAKPGSAATPDDYSTAAGVPIPSTMAINTALAAVNTHRDAHQAPPLDWEESLEATAQQLVDKCPAGDVKVGEGLGVTVARGVQSVAAAVELWYAEVSAGQGLGVFACAFASD